jgi:hypothetical protein
LKIETSNVDALLVFLENFTSFAKEIVTLQPLTGKENAFCL